ncbi:caspase domain-containing protein [Gautieria morchelliformis]|nr:caspase domain-containing protein [Gautieria morchelliformis]
MPYHLPLHPMFTKRNAHVFALLIGIDVYHVKRHLKGCKHDVDLIEQFLKNTFKGHSIKRLVDGEATSDMILTTFKEHFTMNTKIGEEDVMLFYYAGHGSRIKAPDGWVTQDGQIEIICPYDQDTMGKELERICGISDHKLNEMLRKLSSIKHNNNIVAIFDSCYSGGMGRDDEIKGQPENVRSIEVQSPLPGDFEQEAWTVDKGRDLEVSHMGFNYPFMSSHVLLAACRPLEKAKEKLLRYQEGNDAEELKMRGVFTTHLVRMLYMAITMEQSTYATLLDRLLRGWPYEQRPMCEGSNKGRLLFSKKHGGDPDGTFRLVPTSDRTMYRAAPGWIHGVVKGTEFVVHPNRGTFMASEVRSHSCDLVYKDGPKCQISTEARALMFIGKSLALYLQPGIGDSDVSGVSDRYTIVSQPAAAHVVVHSRDKRYLYLAGADKRVPDSCKTRSGPLLPGEMPSVLDKMAYFNFHLHRGNGDRPLHDYIKLELVPLKTIPGGHRIPIHDDSVTLDDNDNKDNCVTNLAPFKYGLTLKNNFNCSIFPYLFCFKPSKCAILSYYVPTSRETPPLGPGSPGQPSKLGIVGYGAEGGDPVMFTLPQGKSTDTVFLKLFVSTTYVDLNIVEQRIDQLRGIDRPSVSDPYIWDAWKFQITSQAGPSVPAVPHRTS